MKKNPLKLRIVVIVSLLGMTLLAWAYWPFVWGKLTLIYRFVSDREQIETFISSYGNKAPLVFMGFQILQVLVAPVPGEISGFIGGYLFGVWPGFVYSSIALAIGSWINFVIGRILGERFVRKIIPAHRWQRIDYLVRHQGVIVLFLLFVFPGFPKDYLCLFLGLTRLPIKVFLVLASVGRMPGTLMLSLQGASLFHRSYWTFAIILSVCLLVAALAYRYRDTVYRWVAKANNKPSNH